MSASGPAYAQHRASSRQIVAPAEQAARDNERVEVLRQELKESEDLLASLASRKAERLAASDRAAAAEAEEQHQRTLSDVAALKRELALTVAQVTNPNGASSSVQLAWRPATPRVATPTPAASPTSSAYPWWDVYGRRQTLP